MSRDKTVVLRREAEGWHAEVEGQDVLLDLQPSALASEAVGLARARFSYDWLGIRAVDVGPAALALHGNVVWMRR